MLIDFTIQNYTSFKEEKTFSFLCNSSQVRDDIALISIENDKYKFYPFSVLLGPNASGKTNLMYALDDFRTFVVHSYTSQKDEKISAYKPYRLNPSTQTAPISFDIEFMTKENHYLYKVLFDKTSILKEELYLFHNGQKLTKSFLFKRTGSHILYGTKIKGEKAVFSTFLLPNRLLLSVIGGNSSNIIVQDAYYFFRDELLIIFPQDEISLHYRYNTGKLLKGNKDLKQLTLTLLQAADIQISDIKQVHNKKIEEEFKKIQENKNQNDDTYNEVIIDMLSNQTLFGHHVYDDNKELISDEYLNFQTSESSGTHKLFELIGAVLLALINGSTLVIDELSSCLHPSTEHFIVELFLSKEINVNGAQLLINTHNINLIDNGDLTREQVWFTDKNKYGESDLFCLDEFDKNRIRDYAHYGKTYLENRIGGLPNICFETLKKELTSYYAKKKK